MKNGAGEFADVQEKVIHGFFHTCRRGWPEVSLVAGVGSEGYMLEDAVV